MTSKKIKKKGARTPSALVAINRLAAGVDIGSRFHVVAVPADMDAEPVRSFQSFTGDLNRLADWLVGLGITTVAMESTGIYWVPVFEILEGRGLEVVLVNARDAKNVPGRKTDVNDAQWIQQLHTYGLLRASFRPGAAIVALRAYMRHRERMLEYAASHVQHMQKALMQMNLQLHHVVSDITGVTGMRILRAIVSGERDAEVLVTFRDVRCKSSVETIREALTGNYQPEHVFALRQAIELYDAYQTKVQDCDAEIERCLRALPTDAAASPPPPARSRASQKNEPAFDVRPVLHALLGVDLTQINGIGPYSALRIIAECGTDMSRWRTAKHFTSWLTLAPGSKISGGKVLSSRTRRSTNRAAVLLRLAATSVGRTDTALGAFFRRLAVRAGKAKAVTAQYNGTNEFGCSSDRRLKRDIAPLGGALDTLLRLKGVTYNWKNPEEQGKNAAMRQTGFIAQEVEEVFPNWVDENADGFKTLAIQPAQVAALEVESIRTLKMENDALRERVAALETGRRVVAGFDLNGLGFAVGGLAIAGALVVSRRKQQGRAI